MRKLRGYNLRIKDEKGNVVAQKEVTEIPKCDNAGTTCLWIAEELGFTIGSEAIYEEEENG